MSRVLYVTSSGLPKDAPSIRVERIAKQLQSIGYEVTILSSYKYEIQVPFEEKERNDYMIINNDLPYLFEYRKKKKPYDKYLDFYELLSARKKYNRIVRFCKKYNPHSIILYNDIYSLTRKLLKFCKKNNIKLFADVTEWYERRSVNAPLPAQIVPILVNRRITSLDKYLDGVIAISPFLYNYYNQLSSNVIFVPPLMPIAKGIQLTINQHRALVYAGSPGEKDVLIPLLDALTVININKVNICLNLVGLSEDDIKHIWKDVPYDRYGIKAFGRLPHEMSLEIVRTSDFGVLFRHNLRYAKAGFSTKFAECLSLGVPMICNKVGGCDLLINNGQDGFLIDVLNKESLLVCLQSILQLSDEDILLMKKSALRKAQSLFDADRYDNEFKKILGYESSNYC